MEAFIDALVGGCMVDKIALEFIGSAIDLQ